MYSSTIFELVENSNYTFYKLHFNGKCQFDEFLESIKRIPEDMKSMQKIIALMDMYGSCLLPQKKIKQIKGIARSDTFEFKYNNIRVYVIVQKPYVYIALGGYKQTQKKDIELLKRRYNNFKQAKNT